jgi:hypothetical protein
MYSRNLLFAYGFTKMIYTLSSQLKKKTVAKIGKVRGLWIENNILYLVIALHFTLPFAFATRVVTSGEVEVIGGLSEAGLIKLSLAEYN